MKKFGVILGAVGLFVFLLILATRAISAPRQQAAQPHSQARVVEGLLSSGSITSVSWGEVNVVVVPESWPALRPSVRTAHVEAFWDVANNKNPVRVERENGVVVAEHDGYAVRLVD